jgi:hypothetical protein
MLRYKNKLKTKMKLLRKISSNRYWLISSAAVLVVASIVLILIFDRKNRPTVEVIPSTNPANNSALNTTSSAGSDNSHESQSNSGLADKSQAGSSPGGELKAPTGTFVSNHKPSLSGSLSPSSEQSVCNTMPGASCYIQFTQGSVVKKLAAQVADGNGNVFWSWDVNEANLTEGKWQIVAVATLDGRTMSSSDSLALEVMP